MQRRPWPRDIVTWVLVMLLGLAMLYLTLAP
jgi:hypothetical protein